MNASTTITLVMPRTRDRLVSSTTRTRAAFKLVIEKQGEYNSYTSSLFLPASYGPLVRDKNGAPVDDKIQEILDKRFYLPVKFQPRNAQKLTEIADKMLHNESSGGSGGAEEDDSEEIEAPVAKTPAQKPAAAPTKKAAPAPAENVVEEEAAPAAEKKPAKQPQKKAEPAPVKEQPKAEVVPEEDPDVAKILSEINDQ
jgi:outer membrane biosynthesis protein TonB